MLALIDDEKNLWLYKPCYVRTSSDKYTLNCNSKFIHLTNNCFQMHSSNYQAYERDNQLSYALLLEYLETFKTQYPDLDTGHVMRRMKDLMIDCHQAALGSLDPNKRKGHKFEVIGFDFLLDEDLRVWLIEVNTCPYMGPVLCAFNENFMIDLLNDTFKLTIDKYFFDQH